MAKRSGGTENIYASVAGSVAGVLGDVVWNSLRLPGYDQPSALAFLSIGDIIQMGGASALTTAGFSMGCSRLSPFGYGMLFSQVLTKVIFPAFDLPRYIIFDMDKKGRIVPEGRFPG